MYTGSRGDALSKPLTSAHDLTGLPAALVSGPGVLPMTASCYQFCRVNFRALSDSRRTQPVLARRYRELARDLQRVLWTNRVAWEPREQSDVVVLRRLLDPVGVDDALVRAAALLTALSLYLTGSLRRLEGFGPVVVASGEAFGAEPILIGPRWPGVIAEPLECARRAPRYEEEISETLAFYHPGLHLAPVRQGDYSLRPCVLPRGTAQLFRARLEADAVRIAVTPLARNARLAGRPVPGFPEQDPSRFVLTETAEDGSGVTRILERCREAGVSILVLPELRTPPLVLAAAVDWLRRQSWDELRAGRGLLLVAAGSWHEGDDHQGWHNRCRVLDHRGEEIWAHDKLAEYNITPDNVTRHPALKSLLGIGDTGGTECIRRGEHLQFCDTAWGRLAVAICVGFFHEAVRPVLEASGANLFLVPAMTPDARLLQEKARGLVRSQHASSFVANCGTVGREAACFYQLPAAGAEPVPLDEQEDLLLFDLAIHLTQT